MDAESFLKVSDQFRLGELVTELPHPETTGLAELSRDDLPEAIRAFHSVDRLMMQGVMASLDPLPGLVTAMSRTLARGGRIFIAGCGATGRLALSLETLAREAWLTSATRERIIGFMAGGDAALIRSIESFEDYPEYGARQLKELGFQATDLLLAVTEGGETPFVIGACLEAAGIATEPPWFLFCNPPDQLCRLAERSKQVLTSPSVRSFFIDTGPMALAGSTRLQATTAQMLVTGAALTEAFGRGAAMDLIRAFDGMLAAHNPQALAPFIEEEARTYGNGGLALYQTDRYGITVLTDTTERSPTFSLAPFESRLRRADPASWCYLSLPHAADAVEAWEALLHRKPRTLEWPALEGRGSRQNLLGHDISRQAEDWRAGRWPDKAQHPYRITGKSTVLEFPPHRLDLGQAGKPLLLRHLLLKCCLNLQSTLVMGRLGRFESNLMTRVRPSNHKLIDRAARHNQHHHRQRTGKDLPYEEAVRRVFRELGKK